MSSAPATVRVLLVNAQGVEMDSFDVRSGSNLWVFIRKRGHAIGAACSGVGVCGACNIVVTAPTQDALAQASAFECETLRRNGKPENQRLACLCRIFGDVTVQADYW